MESKKNIQMSLFTKQKDTHRHRKQINDIQSGNDKGMNWELGINRYTLTYMK